jgi:hypothetical protein
MLFRIWQGELLTPNIGPSGPGGLQSLADPFGHLWWVATHKEDVSPEELKKRAQALFGGTK